MSMANLPHQAQGLISNANAFAALDSIVSAANDFITLRETERSHREEMSAYRALETERIKAAETVLTDYFSKVFAERNQNFADLWARLDEAARKGDTSTVAQLMHGIVDLAKSSPLADLGELPKLRAALDDPDHVWQF